MRGALHYHDVYVTLRVNVGPSPPPPSHHHQACRWKDMDLERNECGIIHSVCRLSGFNSQQKWTL